MVAIAEYHRQVLGQLDKIMDTEPPEIGDFYTALNGTSKPLSVELLAELAPAWSQFTLAISDGNPHIYAGQEVRIEPLSDPLFVLPDAPSAGGKTSVVRKLVELYPDYAQLLKTATTRQPRVKEGEVTEKIRISDTPPVDALASAQYFHVTKNQFLTLQEANFFIEKKPMWETETQAADWYGTPRTSLVNALTGHLPFSFLIVDNAGQVEVKKWLKQTGQKFHIQRWFILPTEQTFHDLRDRIIFQRGDKAAPRIIDAVKDLYHGALIADFVLPNPYEKGGVPNQAVENALILMHALRPDIVT